MKDIVLYFTKKLHCNIMRKITMKVTITQASSSLEASDEMFIQLQLKKTSKYFEKDSENLFELEALNEISNKRK